MDRNRLWPALGAVVIGIMVQSSMSVVEGLKWIGVCFWCLVVNILENPTKFSPTKSAMLRAQTIFFLTILCSLETLAV
jgi:hypothetical protein